MITSLKCVLVDGSTVVNTATVQPLSFEQGEAVTLNLALINSAGSPVDLTGGALIFTVKAHSSIPQPDISREAIVLNAPGGLATVVLEKDDTKLLRATVYQYEVTFIDATGRIRHVLPISKLTLIRSLYTDGDPVTVPGSQQPLGQGPSGTSSVTATGSAAIDAGALLKVSGVDMYAMLGTADDPSLMVGVAVTACGGAGQTFTAQLVAGTVTTMLSDGSAPIATGVAVAPSTTRAGRVKAATANTVGVNIGAAVAAVVDAVVEVL